MLFNSLAFAVFLPVVLAIYWALRTPRRQNLFLVAASLFFYGWWDWRFVSLLVISTGVDYCCALAIARGRKNERTGKRWLVLSLMVNLGLLGVFKYYDFFVGSAEQLWVAIGWSPDLLNVVLPVGISFYTFQTMSYTIDVYRGKFQARTNLIDVAAYVTFFPQLVAGPIERATALIPQLETVRSISAKTIRLGLMLMLVGFLKKMVLADGLAPMVGSIYGRAAAGQAVSPLETLLGAYAFALQVYGDFSGYSDIARGAARLLGFKLMINFRQPYFSPTYSDVFVRWHISFSFWLRDYLYIPLGGSRGGYARTLLNLFLTLFLGGLWHGAAWHFVAWGSLVGFYMVFERLAKLHDVSGRGRLYRAGRALITFHLWVLSCIFFRADTIQTAWKMLGTATSAYTLPPAEYLVAIALGFSLLVAIDLPHLLHPKEELPCAHRRGWRLFTIAVAVVAFVMLPPISSNQFIYFQF